jgi:hypothetical protein
MRMRHVTVLEPSRELCGTTVEQFVDLVERLAPAVDAEYLARADRPGRQRALGGGDRPNPFWFRLLVALTYLRQGTSTRATAAIFGIHEKSVRNYRDEVVRLLAGHGCHPPGAAHPIRDLADLVAYLDGVDTVMVDGTEIPRSMPVDFEAQRAAFSGKSRSHVHKGTVVADGSRRPVWFEANPSGEGRTHDVTMLRAQLGLMAVLGTVAATVLADKAYTGLRHDLGEQRCRIPRQKPRNQPKSEDQRALEHQWSSERMPVEHSIGRMKWWRVLRWWRAADHRFAATGKAIATLASIT